MDSIDIRSLTLDEAGRLAVSLGEPAFRGRQVFEWVNKKLATDFDAMTNISKPLREKFAAACSFGEFKLEKRLVENSTTKYLFHIGKNNIIESVLLKYVYGNTVCVSSQAGCKMGCAFCASAIDGLERDLTAGEMAAQVYEIQKDCGERVSGVVVMGSGEPFDNFDNLVKFIEIINSKDGVDIGQRHITVSTCGIVPGIYKFADLGLQVNLAVSLHAPNDEIRTKIMPVAKKYGIDALLTAVKYYTDKTNRRVTYEYAMIEGVNDGTEHARELGARLRGTLSHVNIIPVNQLNERDFKGSSNKKIESFADIIKSCGIETTIRRKLGSGINAACGQLRRREKILQ